MLGAIVLALAAVMPGVATAQHAEATAGEIRVTEAWARASAGRSGAAYVTLENGGETADRLVSVATDIARKAELHTHKMDNNIMRMRPVEAIDIPPNGSVTLKPGGGHIMLMGLNGKLVEGESFPLTLVFEKAGRVTVTVAIQSVAAMGPGSHGGMQGHHGHN